MFPVLVTVNTPEQLKAVYDLLGGATSAPPADQTQTPAKATKAKAVKDTPAPAAQAAAPVTPPAAVGPSPAGLAFLQQKLAGPVTELSMKDEPKMKAIVAEYGVERVSLIPEALFPEVLQKVLTALDPGAAERARLEALDKAKGSSLL